MVDWKKCLLVLLMLASAASLVAFAQAQAPVPPALVAYPDITTSQAAAGANLVSYKTAVETNIDIAFKLGQSNSAAIGALTDQSAAIVSLQSQLKADEARITALETKLAALATKTVTAGTTLATP